MIAAPTRVANDDFEPVKDPHGVSNLTSLIVMETKRQTPLLLTRRTSSIAVILVLNRQQCNVITCF